MLAQELQTGRDAQQGIAQQATERVSRDHEADRGLRDAQVLAGGGMALDVVAVEQRVVGAAIQDQVQLPGQVVDVLNAAVHAARAIGRQSMRRVAGEKHATIAQPLDNPLIEAIGAQPVDLVRNVADDSANALVEFVGAALLLDIGVRRKLPVDAPQVVGLGVHDQLAARIGRRIEVEVTFVGKREIGTDIGDQEAITVAVAGPLHASQAAHFAVDPIARDQILEAHLTRSIAGFRGHADTLSVLGYFGYAMRPQDLGQLAVIQSLEHDLLGAVLRDVDERREAACSREFGRGQLFATHVCAGDVPGDALRGDLVRAAHLVQDLEHVALDAARA